MHRLLWLKESGSSVTGQNTQGVYGNFIEPLEEKKISLGYNAKQCSTSMYSGTVL